MKKQKNRKRTTVGKVRVATLGTSTTASKSDGFVVVESMNVGIEIIARNESVSRNG